MNCVFCIVCFLMSFYYTNTRDSKQTDFYTKTHNSDAKGRLRERNCVQTGTHNLTHNSVLEVS